MADDSTKSVESLCVNNFDVMKIGNACLPIHLQVCNSATVKLNVYK